MHRPFSKLYKPHAVEHHGKGLCEPQHVDLHPINALIAFGLTSPVWLSYCVITNQAWTAITWFAWLLFWMLLWGPCHRHMHDSNQHKWVEYIPLYSRMRRHHLLHHDKPNVNYGTIFFFSDYFFGTKR
jgi:hypothetical protein